MVSGYLFVGYDIMIYITLKGCLNDVIYMIRMINSQK